MKCYAFDVDETLDISGGPISLDRLVELRHEGHVVGICGNWAVMCRVEGWHTLISFVGPYHDWPVENPKTLFLGQLRTYISGIEEFVMVGNDPLVFGASDDKRQAELAGWRFIREDEFAAGSR